MQIEGGQTNLTDFFEGSLGSGTFAPRRKVTHKSKRLSKAMANLRRQNAEDDEEDVQEIAPRQMASKRKRKPVDVVKVESDDEESELGKETSSEEAEEESSSDDDNVRRMQGERSGSKKKVNKGKGASMANKKSRRKRVKT